MTKALSGKFVQVHYTGKLDDGSTFDSSVGQKPLEFKVGEGKVIAGFEEAVIGLGIGEKTTTKIPSDKAYGPRKKDLILEVLKDQFPPKVKPEVGQQLQIPQQNGQIALVIVTDISEDKVLLDGNHPLAGQNLTFEIELVQISDEGSPETGSEHSHGEGNGGCACTDH